MVPKRGLEKRRCKISTTEENAREKRILLVDDELDITLTLKIALE
ncbi:MAG TPA: hypothetical protein VGW09_08620 [Nitrososphaeraceae archaeon]|nr:hypothetical protein [Nitrososphaeraceae archaeon]